MGAFFSSSRYKRIFEEIRGLVGVVRGIVNSVLIAAACFSTADIILNRKTKGNNYKTEVFSSLELPAYYNFV
jgi:hypothetical protein